MSNKDQMHQNASVSYKMISINEGYFFYINPPASGIENYDAINLRYELSHLFDWSQNTGICTVFLDIKFFYFTNDVKTVLFETKLLINYLLINGEQYITVTENEINMELSLSTMLLSIAISTARGYLAAKMAATEYKNILLPIINPGQLIKDAEEKNKAAKNII